MEPVPEKVVTGTEVRCQNFGILKIYIGYRYRMGTGIGNFHFLWWYGNRYRKNSVPENILGTGIGKIWHRNRYRKNLVPKKVPVSVSKIFGTFWCQEFIASRIQQCRQSAMNTIDSTSKRQHVDMCYWYE